jgi:ligand-binding SRPBCC domain-containing protein
MQNHLNKSIVMNAPLDWLFDTVMHPDNLHTMNPDIEVLSHSASPLGGFDTEWQYTFGAIKLTGKSTVVAYERPCTLVVDTQGGIPSHWVWRFSTEEAGTRVSVEVDYDIPKPLQFMGNMLIKRNEKAVETQLHNLKMMAEEKEQAR